MPGIDDWLPRFDVGERHEIDLAVSPEQALQRALAAPAAPDALVRTLFRLRSIRPDGSIRDFVTANRFIVLEHSPTAFVVGLIVPRPRLPRADPAAWRQTLAPRTLRIAMDFRAEPLPQGSRLTTETRVAATDGRTLFVFQVYWLLVGPFSKLIRRRWLRAIARRTS